jgi:hypothetical protein
MNESKIPLEKLIEMVASMRTVDHQEAAMSQLEQAIFLWFHKDDKFVISEATAIHTLAVAVQGVLWAYAHDSRQIPSTVRQRIEDMRPDQRKAFIDPQNFFKHGNVGRKEKGKRKAVSQLPSLTDFFLVDNVCVFNRLFSISSALLDTFLLRYSLSFPESRIRLETLEVKLVSGGHQIEAIAALDRKTFYDFVGPCAVVNLRENAGTPRPIPL